jgi:hypothetical protein
VSKDGFWFRARPARIWNAMSRFYFHLRSREGLVEDEEGCDLERASEAQKVALRSARCVLSGDVASGILDLEQEIIVTDEQGRTVVQLPFGEAVARPAPAAAVDWRSR